MDYGQREEWSNSLSEFLTKVQEQPFDEWKERGRLSFPEREILKQLVSQERFTRMLKAA